nr:hypothetical protein CFP56_63736 [Quercus suber]
MFLRFGRNRHIEFRRLLRHHQIWDSVQAPGRICYSYRPWLRLFSRFAIFVAFPPGDPTHVANTLVMRLHYSPWTKFLSAFFLCQWKNVAPPFFGSLVPLLVANPKRTTPCRRLDFCQICFAIRMGGCFPENLQKQKKEQEADVAAVEGIEELDGAKAWRRQGADKGGT